MPLTKGEREKPWAELETRLVRVWLRVHRLDQASLLGKKTSEVKQFPSEFTEALLPKRVIPGMLS